MDAQAKQFLLEIGSQLDAGIFPKVKNGGFVMPGESPRPFLNTGVEKSNVERQRWEGPWQPGQSGARRGESWPRSWQSWESRPPGRPGPAGKAAPVVGAPARLAYEQEVTALQTIYPGAQVWMQDERMWLLVPSQLLAGLRQHALFLVGVSYERTAVRSWAFWRDPVVGPAWIGPRHTNYPDGSVCAYEPSDNTWSFGNPLVELLDLYSVWALRHLHLRTFGRWPGAQAVHRPYERLLELNLEEHCGCGSHARSYAECCRPQDLAGDRIRDAIDFMLWSGGGLRTPPRAVTDFAARQRGLDRLNELL